MCLQFFFISKGGLQKMIESGFQSRIIKRVELIFPGCIVFKNDSRQGFPDLLILYKTTWAALECKKSERESYRPNQKYYIDLMNDMSFAAMICPENMEAILNELQQTLSPRRSARISERQ